MCAVEDPKPSISDTINNPQKAGVNVSAVYKRHHEFKKTEALPEDKKY